MLLYIQEKCKNYVSRIKSILHFLTRGFFTCSSVSAPRWLTFHLLQLLPIVFMHRNSCCISKIFDGASTKNWTLPWFPSDYRKCMCVGSSNEYLGSPPPLSPFPIVLTIEPMRHFEHVVQCRLTTCLLPLRFLFVGTVHVLYTPFLWSPSNSRRLCFLGYIDTYKQATCGLRLGTLEGSVTHIRHLIYNDMRSNECWRMVDPMQCWASHAWIRVVL
jgi:hypothetical protein